MNTAPAAPLPADFRDLSALIAEHAARRPDATAIIALGQRLSYAALDALADRVAAALQRDGLAPQQCVAICGASSIAYVAIFIGALRAGLAAAPLAPSSTPAQLAAMVADAGAPLVFIDDAVAAMGVDWPAGRTVLRMDATDSGPCFDTWLTPAGARPQPVAIDPAWPFNLI